MKKKKKLYLDNNVLICVKDDKKSVLSQKLFTLNEDDIIKVYSPAHIEELAGSKIISKSSIADVENDLRFIKKFTNSYELLPQQMSIFKGETYAKKIELKRENPQNCYKRVVDQFNKNKYAEFIDRNVIVDAHENPRGHPIEVNNKKIDEILSKEDKIEIIETLINLGLIGEKMRTEALEWKFDDIKDTFYLVESYINKAANLIEKNGYYREKNTIEVSRSRLHDVSHVIYAAYCDIFICDDKKLLNKTKVIYQLLDIKTNVYTSEEYMKT
jgi:hypothetical protein